MERKIIIAVIIMILLTGCSQKNVCEYKYTLNIESSSHGYKQKTSSICCIKNDNNPKCIPKNRDL
ncbi:MAG: hypothetical protein O3B47_03090, partial [bacterium]|nr:hypothetical protein [bacterium]